MYVSVFVLIASLLLTGVHVVQAKKEIIAVRNFKKTYGNGFSISSGLMQNVAISPFFSLAINSMLSLMIFGLIFNWQGFESVDATKRMIAIYLLQLLCHLRIPLPFFISCFYQLKYFFKNKEWKIELATLVSGEDIKQWEKAITPLGSTWMPYFQTEFSHTFKPIIHEKYVGDILRGKELLTKYKVVKKEVEESKAFLNKEIKEEVELLKFLEKELTVCFDSLLMSIGYKDCQIETQKKKAEIQKKKSQTSPNRLRASEEDLLRLVEDDSTAPDVKEKANRILDIIQIRKKEVENMSKRELDMATIKTAMIFEGITEDDLQN